MQKLPQTAKVITEDVLKNIRGYAIRLEKGHNEERYISWNDRYVYKRSEGKSLCGSF
mgnify:FL=1